MPQVPGEVDRRKFFRAMTRLGWHVVSVRGSHFKLVEAATGKRIIVAAHGTIHRKAILATLHEAGISVEQFSDVL